MTAVISTKTTVFSGVEGESFVFRCEYPNGLTENLKYLCRIDECSSYLIMTDKHNRWETKGRSPCTTTPLEASSLSRWIN